MTIKWIGTGVDYNSWQGTSTEMNDSTTKAKMRAGDRFLNTTDGKTYVYSGSAWVEATVRI